MEKKPQGLKFLATCEDCKKGFEVNPTVLKQKQYEINKRSIWLTYYDCPHCSHRHFVQADDTRSQAILRDGKKMFVRFGARKARGETIPQKQLDKFQRTRQHLTEYRMGLIHDLTGAWLDDPETGYRGELRFSV